VVTRRRVLRAAGDVPVEFIDEVVERMASSMSGGAEARRCDGLSFAFEIIDRPVARLRYGVADGGVVTLSRDSEEGSTFTFEGDAETLDDVLRGTRNALTAILGGGIRMHGSLWHIRGLLRMMPAVERAYVAAREEMIERHSDRFDFRF